MSDISQQVAVTVTYPLLETTEFARSQRVGLTDDRDDIDTRGEPAHELNVNLPQAVRFPIRQRDQMVVRMQHTRDQWER